jgi:[ribosomal protein S18]-alanine N-acetyltransferase
MNQLEKNFRQLTKDDIEQIMQIEKLSFSLPWSKQAYLNELSHNNLAYYYGLFDQDQLIGFGGFWLILDEGHIANMAVHPARRRQGIGEVLMRLIIVQCQSKGAKKMTLDVRKYNYPAQKLYFKLGFDAAGIRPRYYDDPKEDALIMWLEMETSSPELK